MAFVPHYRVVENGSSQRRLAFVLHGVLGSGQNFSRFIQRLASERPEYRYVLVDLRHHGQSAGAPPPNTLAACAADLKALAGALGKEPEVVIGHSFGGKVAIEYARQGAPRLEQVWVLDAVPGAQGGDPTEISDVIRAVRSVPMPAQSRREVVSHLVERAGLSSGLAEWMGTNLKREGEHYVWVFNLDAIEELLRDYFEVDLWSFIAEPRERPQLELVVAEHSARWTPELRARAQALPPSARVVYHELPRSGHWVHVDNPDGLLQIMAEHLT
jgi:pimeloyl-ACP methyl ester carboxylesterase